MKRYWVFSVPDYYPAGGMRDMQASDTPDPRELFDKSDQASWHALDMTTSPPTLVRYSQWSGYLLRDVIKDLRQFQANCGLTIDCLVQYQTYDRDRPDYEQWQPCSAWFSDKVDGLIREDTIQPVGIFERDDVQTS